MRTIQELASKLDIWDQTIGCDECSSAWWGDNAIGEPEEMLWHAPDCALYGRQDVLDFWGNSPDDASR